MCLIIWFSCDLPFGFGFWIFHCVTSSEHEVKLRKHGHGVIMSSSLYVSGLEGLWIRV
jgi:hypothetical protein